MIQLRLILFGVTLIASVGYAFYQHLQSREQQQEHTYGPQRERPTTDIPSPPPTSCNSSGSIPKKRKRVPPQVPGECTICLGNKYQNNERYLDCGHVFHKHCIDAWFNSQKTCPVCRAHVL